LNIHSAIGRFAVKFICLLSLCLSVDRVSLLAQAPLTLVPTISTLTGVNGVSGDAANNVAAADAHIHDPSGIVTDPAGNVYFGDWYNDVVRKVDVTTGQMTVYAGQPGVQGYTGDGGQATAATLSGPMGIAFDKAGNLYIADTHNSLVRKVAANGIITTFAGTGAGGYSGNGGLATLAVLRDPQAVVPDNLGNVYIADSQNSVIRKVVLATGIITTVAGTSVQGYSGDGGPATSAQMVGSYGIAVDAAGNFYFSDSDNGVIRKVTVSTGIITTIAGTGLCYGSCARGDGGPATSAKLTFPEGIAFDGNGNLYFADSYSSFDTGQRNNVIREVNMATGIISTVVGVIGTAGYSGDGGVPTAAHLNNPVAVAIDTFGNMYVTDDGSQTVRAITVPHFPDTDVGSVSTTQNFTLSINAALSITSITAPISQSGTNEYLLGATTGCVVDGSTVNAVNTLCVVPITFAPAFPGLRGVPLVVVTNAGTFKFTLNGVGLGPQAALNAGIIATLPLTLLTPNASPEVAHRAVHPNAPTGPPPPPSNMLVALAVDSGGSLYLADGSNCVVEQFANLTYVPTTVAGRGSCGTTAGDGGLATNATFRELTKLAINGRGDLYIPDNAGFVIREADAATGLISTVAGEVGSFGYVPGGGVATSLTLDNPIAVALDAAGNVYIGDQGSSIVWKLNVATGLLTSVAGNGTGAGYSGDGGLATSAQIGDPGAVAVNHAGDVYIADLTKNVVRKVTAATGIITTYAGTASDDGGYTGDGALATNALLYGPVGLSLDAAGNLYIADAGNSVIRKVNASTQFIETVAGAYHGGNGSYSGDGGPANLAGLNGEQDVALDGAGNLFIADFGNNVVRQVTPAAGLVNFGSARINTSSTAHDVTLTNNGNAPLVLSALTLPADYNLGGPDTTCTATSSLAPAESCVLGLVFLPTNLGALNETLTIVDNQGSQAVTLNGAGVSTSPTSTTLTLAPAEPLAGANVTLTATVSPVPTGSPLGTVTFFNGSTSLGSAPINSSGVATLAIPAIPAGTYSFTAAYAGNATSGSSTSTAVAATVTARIATTTTLAITPAATENAGTPITLTATVLEGGTPVYPGTVVFCNANAVRCDGAAVLATAQLTSTGVASFTFVPGVGTYSINATYQAIAANAPSSSVAQTLTIVATALNTSFTSINATGVPGNYSLTGTVGVFGSAVPTGSVNFLNTTTPGTIGSASLDPSTLGRTFTQAAGSPIALQSIVQVGVTWGAGGDFNHDGIPDLVALGASNLSSQAIVLLGVGDGTFQAPVGYGVGQFPQFVTVADVNNDGNPDLVVADTNSNDVGVLLGNPNGTFQAETTTALADAPSFIAVGDLNGDGNLDLVTANTAANTITVLLGSGTGAFPTRTTYAVGNATGVAIGDFDGDGIPDLAVSNANGYPSATAGSISLLAGAGDGSFAAPTTVAVPSGVSPAALLAADLRKTGALDLIFADNGNFTGTAAVYTMLGNNDGTFAPVVTYPTPLSAISVSLGDINGDGILDLVVPANDSDGDGTVVSLLLGAGDGTFAAHADYPMGGYAPQNAVLADFNGDGLLDIATANYGTRDVAALLQQRTESATLLNAAVLGTGAQLADASYPGDSTHTASVSATTSLLPAPPVVELTVSPNPAVTGANVTMTATIVVTSGTATGTVSFYSGATLLATATLSGGVASASTTALTGRALITAVYSGSDFFSAATSPVVVESVGAATATTLSATPSPVTAGMPVTLTATVTPNPGTTPVSGQMTFDYQVTVNDVVHTGSYGPVALNSAGTAAWKFIPGAGTYLVTANFAGTVGDNPSTSAAQTVVVTANAVYGSSTTLTANTLSPGNYTLLASVTAFGQTAPTGLVSFINSDTTTVLGTGALEPASLTHSLVQGTGSPLNDSAYPPAFIVAGDLNGDGVPDLVTAASAGNVIVQLGTGNGAFGAPVALTLSNPIASVSAVIADVNGDGKPDLIVTESESFGVFLGNGDGTFAAESLISTGPGGDASVAAADLNGDGILDLAIAAQGRIDILLGAGDGTFPTETVYRAGTATDGLAVADFNHDGIPDIIESDQDAGTLSLLLGEGDGTFLAATTIVLPGTHPLLLTAADLRHSGTKDVIVTDSTNPDVYVLLGNNDGTFQPAAAYSIASGGASQVIAGDMTNDGILDLAVANSSLGTGTTLSILPGRGDGTFSAHVDYPTGLDPVSLTLADFNGDGLLDVATANFAGLSETVYLQQQTVTATVADISLAGVGNHNVLAGYPGDASRLPSQALNIVLTGANLTTPTVTTLTSSTLASVAGAAVIFTATITPTPTGSPLGTVGFYSGETLLGTAPVNSSGVAALSVVSLPIGADGVTAVYSGNALFATSTSVAVTENVSSANAAATTTTLDSSNAASSLGVPVTFTATIMPVPSGETQGIIRFYNGAVLLNAVTVNSLGVATLVVSTLPAGADSIIAVYSGNTGFRSSQSAPLVETIAGAVTTTLLTASPAGVVFGQVVTLAVTIAPVPTGSPLGTVSFYNGATLLGTSVVSVTGAANILTSSLPGGPAALTAVYSGNSGFAPSTSAPITFVVGRAATTATLAADPSVTLATTPVTFTAQLASTTAGMGTGSFNFLDGATVIATVPMQANGQSVYSTSVLGDGVHSITASYSGDSNYLPSNSSGTPISVTIADINLNLGGDNNKTVVPGAAVTYNFPLSPLVTPTFLFPVTLAASGLPPGATYSFAPATIPAGAGTTPTALTVQTAASTSNLNGEASRLRLALGFGLILPFAGIRVFRKKLKALPRWLVLLSVIATSVSAMLCLSSCGGGFAGPAALPAPTSYTITVTATSGALVRTSTVQLNIQ
jgi:hypothetical protein